MQSFVRSRRSPALPLYAAPIDVYSKGTKNRAMKRSVVWIVCGCSIIWVLFCLMLAWLSTPIFKAYKTARSPDHASEWSFETKGGRLERFPSILADLPEVTVSVVVPAYNEEERLPEAMDELIAHLKSMEATHSLEGDEVAQQQRLASGAAPPAPFAWEVIIVDDGSKDSTVAAAQRIAEREGPQRVRVLVQHANSGKGGAVRRGALRARGHYVLMADADGATRAADLTRLLAAARRVQRGGMSFAIGSRAHMEDGAAAPAGAAAGGAVPAPPPQRTVRRSALRRALMWGFHSFVSLMVGGAGIRDTQCGFKLFSRAAAQALFPVLHIERWAFDVELVYLAARKDIPMVEVPVTWVEKAGSKVDVASASLQMARDIIVIRLCYLAGIWSDAVPPQQSAAMPASPAPPAVAAPQRASATGAADTAQRAAAPPLAPRRPPLGPVGRGRARLERQRALPLEDADAAGDASAAD